MVNDSVMLFRTYHGGTGCPQRGGKMNAAWPPDICVFDDRPIVFGEADPPSKSATCFAFGRVTTTQYEQTNRLALL